MIKLISFGHKVGTPEADIHVDCRPLKNPHGDPKLRPLDGRDAPVRKFVADDYRTPNLLKSVVNKAQDGQTIAFGCFGGRHRSVAMAEMAGESLKAAGHKVEIHHRELRERRTL
jgi:RNase adapter protein RapZ